jgi:hypothetical protein
MTEQDLKDMASQSLTSPAARANFGMLLAFLFDAGMLKFQPQSEHPNRTHSDVRTDANRHSQISHEKLMVGGTTSPARTGDLLIHNQNPIIKNQ